MSKATPTDVINLGFDKTQFGSPADWASTDPDPAGYLQRLLDDVALQVEELVGATAYAAATSGIDLMRMKNAEMYLTAAELWRRIEMFERTNATKGRGGDGAETISSRALRNAEVMEERAEVYLMQMGVSLSSASATGIAVGVNESGPYTAVTS